MPASLIACLICSVLLLWGSLFEPIKALHMEQTLIILQLIFGALLTASVLLQAKGASLGEAFGGSNVFYGSRRGPERTLFIITVVLAVLFVGFSFVLLFV